MLEAISEFVQHLRTDGSPFAGRMTQLSLQECLTEDEQQELATLFLLKATEEGRDRLKDYLKRLQPYFAEGQQVRLIHILESDALHMEGVMFKNNSGAGGPQSTSLAALAIEVFGQKKAVKK